MIASAFQSFLMKILPSSWAESCERESRRWMVKCPCGYEESVWDHGGVRWKATGQPRRKLNCPACGERTWQVTYYAEEARPAPVEDSSDAEHESSR